MKILFLLHALLKEIQECFSSHLNQEFSAINGLRLSTNVCFCVATTKYHRWYYALIDRARDRQLDGQQSTFNQHMRLPRGPTINSDPCEKW